MLNTKMTKIPKKIVTNIFVSNNHILTNSRGWIHRIFLQQGRLKIKISKLPLFFKSFKCKNFLTLNSCLYTVHCHVSKTEDIAKEADSRVKCIVKRIGACLIIDIIGKKLLDIRHLWYSVFLLQFTVKFIDHDDLSIFSWSTQGLRLNNWFYVRICDPSFIHNPKAMNHSSNWSI